ncbi:MAG: hypothetical protein ABI705_10280 [Aestuariivirga sp.]
MEARDSRLRVITLTGYIHCAKRSITATNEALTSLLKNAHFADIRFQLNKAESNYKYHKIGVPDDGVIVVWIKLRSYVAVETETKARELKNISSLVLAKLSPRNGFCERKAWWFVQRFISQWIDVLTPYATAPGFSCS